MSKKNLLECKVCAKVLSDYRSVFCMKHTPRKSIIPSEEVKQKRLAGRMKFIAKCRALYGKGCTPSTAKKLSIINTGIRPNAETRKKMAESSKRTRNGFKIGHKPTLFGEKHPWWRGGVTPLNKLIRTSEKYKRWRNAVFQRDDYTCVFCGVRGGILHADHIKPFCLFPELRFELTNGRTLCKDCHKKTDTYGRKALSYNNIINSYV